MNTIVLDHQLKNLIGDMKEPDALDKLKTYLSTADIDLMTTTLRYINSHSFIFDKDKSIALYENLMEVGFFSDYPDYEHMYRSAISSLRISAATDRQMYIKWVESMPISKERTIYISSVTNDHDKRSRFLPKRLATTFPFGSKLKNKKLLLSVIDDFVQSVSLDNTAYLFELLANKQKEVFKSATDDIRGILYKHQDLLFDKSSNAIKRNPRTDLSQFTNKCLELNVLEPNTIPPAYLAYAYAKNREYIKPILKKRFAQKLDWVYSVFDEQTLGLPKTWETIVASVELEQSSNMDLPELTSY